MSEENTKYTRELARAANIINGAAAVLGLAGAAEALAPLLTQEARPLAAAPDLLEALDYAMLLIAESPGASELYRAAAERKARAAIAKARGEG